MFEEYAPPIPVARLIVHIGFGDVVGCVEPSASDYVQGITFLGGCLMWNNAAVYGGRIRLNFFVSVWSDMWKYRERESAMVFYFPLMCCEHRDLLLMTRIHPS